MRVLFVALAQSSHTHAWVTLLDSDRFDVRIFGIDQTESPRDFPVPTYGFFRGYPSLNPRRNLWFRSKGRLINLYATARSMSLHMLELQWLSRVIREWQPDIVHTLGLDPASYAYLELLENFDGLPWTPWVVTARGGPEVALMRLQSEPARRISAVLSRCDFLVADNPLNYEYALNLGLDREKVAPFGIAPGTGGIDVDAIRGARTDKPSNSRLILFPKAYECPQSKALPVLEALCIAWERLPPCTIHMTAVIPEVRMWIETLPAAIRAVCTAEDRIPRDRLLRITANARVVLAPSLSDGIPNTLYEAMAAGALPIVSPLESFRHLVKNSENVLFARNLYPEEIAEALVRAMTDDKLVDESAERNLALVRSVADRARLAERVSHFYEKIVRAA